MNKSESKVDKTKSPSAVFVGMALDMSWRLAVVVLVPVIGGAELDKRLNTSPWLFITGLAVALAGMVLVLRRMLQEVNKVESPKKDKHV